LLESLDLRDATLVPHDWGMHSLYWAIHHPQRLRGLFILNTIAHRRREEIKLPLAIRLFRNRGTGPLLVKRLDLVRRFLGRAAAGRGSALAGGPGVRPGRAVLPGLAAADRQTGG
jgi:pimeloyl-ACP methyl ester carboxylesterase